jgi:porphobilinogen deaminase
VLSVDGTEAVRVRRAGVPADAERIAREVVAELRSRGADRLMTLGGKSLGAP